MLHLYPTCFVNNTYATPFNAAKTTENPIRYDQWGKDAS